MKNLRLLNSEKTKVEAPPNKIVQPRDSIKLYDLINHTRGKNDNEPIHEKKVEKTNKK